MKEVGQQVTNLGPTLHAVDEDIIALSKQVDDQNKKRDGQVRDLENKIRGEHKQNALEAMKAHLKDQILAEVKSQVRAQMGQQMYPTHLPKPLLEQVEDGRAQIVAMKAALHNSNARRENAGITAADLSRRLTPVHKPDGIPSALFPADLNTLLSYDGPRISQLMADYDLLRPGLREDYALYLNLFIAYIGVVEVSVMTPTGFGSASFLASSSGR
ncbi:hypothetical protein FKP32DRAFT_1587749 [Trametes sanguinea]|nr:hypothetical protein FKP32DRAFT_1587749 [Trametes sanguinea]